MKNGSLLQLDAKEAYVQKTNEAYIKRTKESGDRSPCVEKSKWEFESNLSHFCIKNHSQKKRNGRFFLRPIPAKTNKFNSLSSNQDSNRERKVSYGK